jgi:hypothetical protein
MGYRRRKLFGLKCALSFSAEDLPPRREYKSTKKEVVDEYLPVEFDVESSLVEVEDV